MRYLIVLACLLIAAVEALATEVTFPGAVAEGYPKIAEVAGYRSQQHENFARCSGVINLNLMGCSLHCFRTRKISRIGVLPGMNILTVVEVLS